MKKLLGVALALTMGVTCTAALAGCDSCGSASEEDKATLAKAMTSIRTLVINKYDKTETSRDYEIYGSVRVDGEDYAVSWELSSTDSNIADYIKLGEMNATTKIINVSVTRPETAVEYTMKATIKVGGASDSASFTATIPAGMTAGDGTEANPYTVSQAFAIAGAMDPKEKYGDDDNPTRVYVTGYVVDCGSDSAGNNHVGFVKIAESTTAEEADWFMILSINYGDILTGYSDLTVGSKITVAGYLMNYQESGTSTTQPELTYWGDNGITCVAYEKVELTAAQKVAAALEAVNIPTTVTGNIILPTVDGVTITMVSDNTDVIANDGTVTRPEAGENDATVGLTVTASVDGVSDSKTVSVTVKAKAEVVAGEAKLELTKEVAAEWGTGTSYAGYNGEHSYEGYTITTNQVMPSTYGEQDVLQFQAEKATLSLDGEFSKIVIVIASTYDFASSNPVVITAGSETLEGTLTNTEDTGIMVTSGKSEYELHLYTMEFTVTGSGSQTIIFAKTTKGAGYLTSIAFYD